MKVFVILFVSLTMALAASAQQAQDKAQCPMHEQHMKNQAATSNQQQTHSHFDAVDSRGDKGMGFDHARTTHHFLLKPEGGIIRVEVNDAADGDNRTAIRNHLAHISTAFSQGDFNIPMFVHDQTPPGVAVMRSKKSQITYEYHELPTGAEVRITTADAKAITAIHNFLTFQIQDHRTGDSLSVQ
jgi:hypothetical protein